MLPDLSSTKTTSCGRRGRIGRGACLDRQAYTRLRSPAGAVLLVDAAVLPCGDVVRLEVLANVLGAVIDLKRRVLSVDERGQRVDHGKLLRKELKVPRRALGGAQGGLGWRRLEVRVAVRDLHQQLELTAGRHVEHQAR